MHADAETTSLPRTPTPSVHESAGGRVAPRRLLITAGPTHEPIDAVRYVANRSSGRLGIALADHAARAADADLPTGGRAHAWEVRLLLGPTPLSPLDSRVQTHRFRTTADLQALLHDHLPWCTVLVMAAAVADYRPRLNAAAATGKLRRTDQTLTIELDPTPDLLAACVAKRRPDQVIVGFALDPRETLLDSARAKLARKGVNLIVANPLEAMDSPVIQATVLAADGSEYATDGTIDKGAFADWLLAIIERHVPTLTPGVPQGTHV